MQANAVATYLTRRLKETVPGISFPYPTQANEVFAHIPDQNLRHKLMARAKAYPWDDGLVRFVCSFDTKEQHVDRLLAGMSASS
jgi:threonine aldolase